MEACGVCHVLILAIHSEEFVDHVQDLSARDVSLLGLTLLGFSLFDVLTEEVRVTWDALHQGCKEHRVEADEATGLSECCKARFRFLTF